MCADFAFFRLCVKMGDMAADSFHEFVLDQLASLPEVRARAMFGACGLYQGGHFFAILDEGRLFFRTDAASAADYLAYGMEPFAYARPDKRVITFQYHEVPPDVLENASELMVWASRAIKVAAGKPRRPRQRFQPK